MDLQTRKALIRKLAKLYHKATWKVKGDLIDQLVVVTGYGRSYASYILTHPPRCQQKKIKRQRPTRYQVVLPELKKLWSFSNFACGKRLVGMLSSYIESLTRDGEMNICQDKKELLLRLSAATVDRMLKTEKKKVAGYGRTTTRPGTLLKSHIPIQVFTRWDEEKPGFAEVDLVAHCSPTGKRGICLYTEFY